MVVDPAPIFVQPVSRNGPLFKPNADLHPVRINRPDQIVRHCAVRVSDH